MIFAERTLKSELFLFNFEVFLLYCIKSEVCLYVLSRRIARIELQSEIDIRGGSEGKKYLAYTLFLTFPDISMKKAIASYKIS